MNVEKLTLPLGLRDLEHGLEEHEALEGKLQLRLGLGVIEILTERHLDDLRSRGLDVGHTVL